MRTKQHVVVLPYFCQAEIHRYLKIGERLKQYAPPSVAVHYLLANSHRTEPSQELLRTYNELGTCTQFTCPTPVGGYPQGATAMFWDCLEFVAQTFSAHEGFCLWLESDMAPVKTDWLDRLSHEWFCGATPLMMGCHVPDIYKRRLFRRPKLILHEHINGGACYALDFAHRMPAAARHGVFDMTVYQCARAVGEVRASQQIAFSTLARVRRDVQAPDKVLLHGFMQDKDAFVDACLMPISEREKNNSLWHPYQEQFEQMARRVRVHFVRRGQRALLENVLLAKFDKNSFAANER